MPGADAAGMGLSLLNMFLQTGPFYETVSKA